MLKYKSGGLFMGIVKTVRTVNPLGSNPNGYRYALFCNNIILHAI
jgi:hypothetical protein